METDSERKRERHLVRTKGGFNCDSVGEKAVDHYSSIVARSFLESRAYVGYSQLTAMVTRRWTLPHWLCLVLALTRAS